MVLHPLSLDGGSLPTESSSSQNPCSAYISPWLAVERKQKQSAEEWLLIAQPDHAALAGDLGARLDSPLVPKLDDDVLEGIRLHDSGWTQFDGGERGTGRDLEVSLRDPQMSDSGKPLSFLEIGAEDVLAAWHGSIERAAKASPIGGILVSEHFCRIGKERLRTKTDTPEDTAKLHTFLQGEEERQAQLQARQARSRYEINLLVDVLQFCDLLSLYLCCGSREKVEFPQQFSGVTVRACWDDELLRTEPSLFGKGTSLGVTARRFPIFGAVDVSSLGFLIL
jgi:Protein of unknown function (DUF3891)